LRSAGHGGGAHTGLPRARDLLGFGQLVAFPEHERILVMVRQRPRSRPAPRQPEGHLHVELRVGQVVAQLGHLERALDDVQLAESSVRVRSLPLTTIWWMRPAMSCTSTTPSAMVWGGSTARPTNPF